MAPGQAVLTVDTIPEEYVPDGSPAGSVRQHTPRGHPASGLPIIGASHESSEAGDTPRVYERSSLGDGVCRVCCGAKVMRVDLTHNCTNCSGKGFCAASAGGNRFVCTFCKGTGQVTNTVDRGCELCGGTGCSRSVSEIMSSSHLELQQWDRGDSVDKVKFEDQKLILENLELSISCLFQAAGLFVVVVGFAFLMGKRLVVACVLLLSGTFLILFAVGHRLYRIRRDRKAAAESPPAIEVAAGQLSGTTPPSPRSPRRPEAMSPQKPLQVVIPLSFDHVVTMTMVITLPNVFLVYFFSTVGIGIEAFSAVAPPLAGLLGSVALLLGALTTGIFLVLDWLNWPLMKKIVAAAVPLILQVAGSILKGRDYPWLPPVMLMVLVPLGLGLLRISCCRNVKHTSFYKAAALCLLFNDVVLLVVWLVWIALGNNEWTDETTLRLREASSVYEYVYEPMPLDYDRHCGPQRVLMDFSAAERQDIKGACNAAAHVMLVAYATPFVAFVGNGAMMAFCCLGRVMPEAQDVTRFHQVVHAAALTVVAMVSLFLGCVYAASVSFRLGETLLMLLSVAAVAILVWGYVQLRELQMTEQKMQLESLRIMPHLWHSDWFKALVLSCLNVLIPVGLFMSWLNMKVRKWRRRTTSEAKFTPLMEKTLKDLSKWNWVSVLSKVCVLAELFVLLDVGIAKAFYVFLSWLSSEIESFPLISVVSLSLVAGYVMLLLPPVPGVPVYVFIGNVVVQRGRRVQNVGFAGSVLISVIISFMMKLVVSITLYLLGCVLGKSKRVQKFVGVDTVHTRAIEKILKEHQLTLGKVSILIGGFDWPTSVICGILRMGLLRMISGTCVVIFLICPCVLAGAFLSLAKPGEESVWSLLAEALLGSATLISLVSLVSATNHILTVVRRHESELELPRKEHERVEDLTRQSQSWQESYATVTKWHTLERWWKVLLAFVTVLHLVNLFCLTFLYEVSYREFSVNIRIFEEGIDGDPLKLVLRPLGWAIPGIFASATMLHLLFSLRMRRLATLHLRRSGGAIAAATPPPEGDPPHVPTSTGRPPQFHDGDGRPAGDMRRAAAAAAPGEVETEGEFTGPRGRTPNVDPPTRSTPGPPRGNRTPRSAPGGPTIAGRGSGTPAVPRGDSAGAISEGRPARVASPETELQGPVLAITNGDVGTAPPQQTRTSRGRRGL